MKPRRVVVTLEIESDETLKQLKDKLRWECTDPYAHTLKVLQIQVNVVKTPRVKKTK